MMGQNRIDLAEQVVGHLRPRQVEHQLGARLEQRPPLDLQRPLRMRRCRDRTPDSTISGSNQMPNCMPRPVT